jgi:hypothetical protein
MTWPRLLFIVIDVTLACGIAWVAGWLTVRRVWYDRGYRAGAARAGRLAERYYERPEPTEAVRRSGR